MVGTLTDNYEWAKYNPIGWWYKPWFYKHVEVRLVYSPSALWTDRFVAWAAWLPP
jgi:hypothetical protein